MVLLRLLLLLLLLLLLACSLSSLVVVEAASGAGGNVANVRAYKTDDVPTAGSVRKPSRPLPTTTIPLLNPPPPPKVEKQMVGRRRVVPTPSAHDRDTRVRRAGTTARTLEALCCCAAAIKLFSTGKLSVRRDSWDIPLARYHRIVIAKAGAKERGGWSGGGGVMVFGYDFKIFDMCSVSRSALRARVSE